MKLDVEEQEILNDFESGKFVSSNKDNKRFEEYAKNTLKKDERITIRLAGRDLTEIKKKAITEGIPYQTLISSILHKYITGNLKQP
jgi:predicted DNA binding CopG/RHH family protein